MNFDTSSEFAQNVSKLIRSRRTAKIVATAEPIHHPHDDAAKNDSEVLKSISDAGFAPFHYDRGVNGLAEPWRFYLLKQDECREIGGQLASWFPDMRPNNKLPAMLNACGCLVLVTWLPQFDRATADEKQIQIDEEHLAATASATQNLLLSLTAKNFRTYWSSGGFFRMDEMLDRLKIDRSEKLLSAIFVDYGANEKDVEVLSGKQHTNRSDRDKWTRVIELG